MLRSWSLFNLVSKNRSKFISCFFHRNNFIENENEGNSFNVPEGLMNSTSLKNGIKVICEHRDEFASSALGCFIPAGSIHESPHERGASLFMEHLLFRRTRHKKANDIEKELSKIGGKLSTIAMRDIFIFHGTVPSCDFEKFMRLFAEIITDGIISNEDIENEKIVILRFLKNMEMNFENVAMDYLPTIAYQGTELSKSIYADTCTIENITAEQINSFKNRLFKPKNMTMISTGGTSFEEFQCLAERYFDLDDQCTNENENLICEEDVYPESLCFRYTGSEMRYRDDDQGLGYVAMAVEGPGHENCEDHCALTVAKQFIGQWSMTDGEKASFYLNYHEIMMFFAGGYKNNAPKLARCAFGTDLCHSYKSFNIGWQYTGLWGCYFVCDPLKLEDMTYVLQNEWMRLCTSITSKEVARAVNQCKTQELLRIDTPEDKLIDIAMCVYHRGHYQTLNERLQRFDRVSADVVRQVADEYIYDQCLVIVALGQIENLPDYNFIRSYMYQLRR